MQSEDGADPAIRDWTVFFWVGLAGIVATGLIVGMGSDNYWALSKVSGFGEPSLSPNGPLLFLAGAILVGLFDLAAVGVIFTGVVILVLRLQGRD